MSKTISKIEGTCRNIHGPGGAVFGEFFLKFNCEPHYSNKKNAIKPSRAISAINLRSPLDKVHYRGHTELLRVWREGDAGLPPRGRPVHGGSNSSASTPQDIGRTPTSRGNPWVGRWRNTKKHSVRVGP